MSHKNPKLGKNQPRSQSNEATSNQSRDQSQSNVRVWIETDSLQGLIDEYRAAREKRTPTENLQLLLGAITLTAIVVYTVLTGWYVRTANKTYTAAYRPYVGIQNIMHSENPKTHDVGIQIEIKNSGTVPADGVESELTTFENGVRQSNESDVTPKPAKRIMIPGQSQFIRTLTDQQGWLNIVSGRVVLEFEIRLQYSGPDGAVYKQCERDRYMPEYDYFPNLGQNCENQNY
jgi:hypothetical protein